MATFQIEPDISRDAGDIYAGDVGQRKRDCILLGKLAESGRARKLWLDLSGEQVVSIYGKRGTGKSYTLGVMLEGLAAGKGQTPIAKLTTPRATLVLDIMDIFWTSQLSLAPMGPPQIVTQYQPMSAAGYASQELNIDLWIPAGYENIGVDPVSTRVLRVGLSDLELDDWGALFDINPYTEPRGQLLSELLSRVGDVGYTGDDGNFVAPKDNYELVDLLNCLEADPYLRSNYRDESTRSVRQRLRALASLPLFASQGTPLTDFLSPFRVSVLRLARLPDALKSVLVAVLLRRLMRDRRDASFAQKRLDLDGSLDDSETARLRRVVEESVPRSAVLLDEAHVLASASEFSVSREALIRFAKEGRNFGLSLVFATQQPSAVDGRVLSQVETSLVHQLTSPKDASLASENTRSPLPTKLISESRNLTVEQCLQRLEPGYAMFSSGNAPAMQRLCVLQVRPRVSAHGGYEA